VEITALPIYDVRLIRDKLTSTSRGFCFVELGSVEVMQLHCPDFFFPLFHAQEM